MEVNFEQKNFDYRCKIAIRKLRDHCTRMRRIHSNEHRGDAGNGILLLLFFNISNVN